MKKIKFTLLFLLLIVWAMYNMVERPNETSLKINGAIGLLQLILSVYSWIRIGNKLISPYFFFLLCLYVFSFGQSFFYPLNVHIDTDLIYTEQTLMIFNAQCLTLIFLNCFHFGALRSKNISHYISDCNNIEFPNLKIIGWIMFIISAYPYLHGKLSSLQYALSHGYASLYEIEQKFGLDVGLKGVINDFFIPSTICLYVAYHEKKIARYLIFGLWITLIIIMLNIGGRTRSVILITLMLILYNNFVKPFTKKQLIIVALGGMVVLSLLSYIRQTRNSSNRSMNITNMLLDDNGAVQTIAEMGNTMFCMIHTMEFVPAEEDYRYGKSYAYSFTTLIPNLGFWEEHPAKKEANLGEWLTNKMELSYGSGYSMVAEAYMNFGPYGFIMMYILGFFFASMFGVLESAIKKKNAPVIVFTLIVFWMSLRLPRNSFIGLVRSLFYYGFLLYLIIKNKKKPIA